MTIPSHDADSSGVAGAFDLLVPGLQRQLWRMNWRELRPLQVEGIRAILQSEQHVILAAPTASGKTEAAFLPILSRLVSLPPGSVRALYVGPLKALINDQFSRINDLCGYLEMPVYHWHGDVPAAEKVRLVEKPGGVLLITPESLESLFINRSSVLSKLFGGLQFIVIDELHSFLETARGLHLRSLLCRLRGQVHEPERLRMVGLSATLGDLAVAKQYLDREHPEHVTVIEDSADGKELKLRLHAYQEAPTSEDDDEQAVPDDLRSLATDLVRHCHGASNLVFANSRSQVEELADVCREIAGQQHLLDQFLVHHGSLSAEIRQDTEEILKSGTVATAFCSSTLEMGIDIGSVRTVCQVDPPWSVAALKQRLGRSGRKSGEPQILRMYVPCRHVEADSDLFDRLHLNLVQAVAMTELLLEKWVEPPELPRYDLSTLTHQILSVIGQTGGLRTDRLYERLVTQGAFQEIEPALFSRLLRQLASKKVLEQMAEGDLILGLTGEALLRHRTFYAVFQTPDEYAVLHGESRLGTLEIVPEPGQHLIFAGARWFVDAVDRERKEIHVVPARGKKRPKFAGAGGLLHTRIVQKMREVLAESKPYSYLDTTGTSLLEAARQTARETGVCTRPMLSLGNRKTALMAWAGTRAQHTLLGMLGQRGLKGRDELIAIVLDARADEVVAAVGQCLACRVDETALAEGVACLVPERKYDWLLGESLRWLAVERGYIDVAVAQTVLRDLGLPKPTARANPQEATSIVAHPPDSLPTLVVLDFETANACRNSACSIGLVKIVGGQIVQKTGFLIRPPTSEFASINSGIHGITWEQVEDALTFAQLWSKLKVFWADAEFLVAHNAPFDRSVLEACCQHYDLSIPRQDFLCTLILAPKYWPELESHQLNTVCHHLGITLQHHEAVSDAVACAQVLLRALTVGYRVARQSGVRSKELREDL